MAEKKGKKQEQEKPKATEKQRRRPSAVARPKR
jgi:hypothetical protein